MQTSKKTKLLIVTSYDRPCGIAQYVEHIEVALRNIPDLEVSIVSLPVDIFRSYDSLAKRKAKLLIRDICKACSNADVVNIQFEHGLFGISPFTIYSRLKKIVKASKKCFITHHTCMSIATTTINNKLSKAYLKALLRNYHRNYVITKLLKLGNNHKNAVYHIVPTKADKENMVLYSQVRADHIFTAPLAFLTAADKAAYQNIEVKASRTKYLGAKMADQKLIGVFGFLGETKGIETAIHALSYLPEDYHLAIVGGLHPEKIVAHKLDQTYITKLTALITENKSIYSRVHFVGSVNNSDFTTLMNLCDIVALPYAEVMQSSSGPAAIALDLGKPILCSHNRGFTELEKFATNCLVFCEISNHLEFARKAQLICDGVINNSGYNQEYRRKYNVETRAQIYRELCVL